ncbi:MAG: flagellar hook-associated protein FlgL [Chloroflexi bacterium]|nr:flagellar hook-associated protein FlgL [Chloroflexota bacterium]
MRITSRMMVDNLRQNINYNSEHLAELQDQLSSGKRLRKPSDDPQAVSRALTLRTTSAEYDQYKRNISSARGWMEASDTALNQIGDSLRRARDISLRGSSNALDKDALKALGKQVDNFLQEALQAGNTTHEGRYIFGGFQVGPGTMPFGELTVTPSIVYRGDSNEMKLEIAPGVQLGVNVWGNVTVGTDQVLTNGLQAMLSIRDQLLNSATVTLGQIEQLTTALDELPAVRSTVGAKMERINQTEDAIKEMQTNVTLMLSREQDADVAEVMTKLMMQENVYKAALNVGARVIQPSLLDFLK